MFGSGMLDDAGTYKPGDMPPEGYLPWHEWATVQHNAGLRQKRCCKCSKWKFPQELQGEPEVVERPDSRGQMHSFTHYTCLGCAVSDT